MAELKLTGLKDGVTKLTVTNGISTDYINVDTVEQRITLIDVQLNVGVSKEIKPLLLNNSKHGESTYTITNGSLEPIVDSPIKVVESSEGSVTLLSESVYEGAYLLMKWDYHGIIFDAFAPITVSE